MLRSQNGALTSSIAWPPWIGMPKNRRSLNRDRHEGTFVTNRIYKIVGKLSVEGRLIYRIKSRANERVDARDT